VVQTIGQFQAQQRTSVSSADLPADSSCKSQNGSELPQGLLDVLVRPSEESALGECDIAAKVTIVLP
jgi:hypothetical protein